MKEYDGAVLFVDLLGFGALTQGQIKLTAEHFAAWGVKDSDPSPHQALAARLLLAFRKHLNETSKRHIDVHFAQLSDCCFIWAKDIAKVTDAGREFMTRTIGAGLLCRGGIASGRILEPELVNRSLGAFIVGDAVTRAVKLEASGKGARIFTDMETAQNILRHRPKEDQTFAGLTNPMTGAVIDEWKWYSPPDINPRLGVTITMDAIKKLVNLHSILRYSPLFAWNAATNEGKRQIACSIASISDCLGQVVGNPSNYSFTVETLLAAEQPRSDEIRIRVSKQFLNEIGAINPPAKRQRKSR